MSDLETLKVIETVLAQHRGFGRSGYINQQLEVCYDRHLEKLALNLPVAGQLLDALRHANTNNRHRVIADTVVRCAVQHAVIQFETGTQYGLPLSECEEVFRAAIRHVEEGKSGGPLESGLPQDNRLGSEPHYSWVWSEEHCDDIFGRSFRYIIKDNYDGTLCTPDSDELGMLAKGVELLNELLPLLAPSTLGHAHLICIFPGVGAWKSKASSSSYSVSGAIFLNRELLKNAWWVAEHLLHESLHQKLYDFRHGHSLLEPNYWREDAPRVCSLWNTPGLNRSNYWDTHRALAACHVYVHLALLCTLAERRGPELEKFYGPMNCSIRMTESRRAFERAHYLSEKIRELCWQEVGLAGKRLTNWLTAVLNAFDPSPPPVGSYVHLLLDLYQRETKPTEKKIELFLSKVDPSSLQREATVHSDVPEELIRLINDEVEATDSVLSTMNLQSERIRFAKAVAQYSNHELKNRFSHARTEIYRTLSDLSSDGSELKCCAPESKTPGEIVKDMVESSSWRLDIMRTKLDLILSKYES